MNLKGQFKLANSNQLNKYLKEIDRNKYYSNFGPLHEKTRYLIKKKLNLKNNDVILTSSGHSSLLAITKYLKTITKKKYVLCPSFSFYSNPLSIIDSGFKPFFVDISRNNLTIDFDKVEKILKKRTDVAFLMVVSPFGIPIDLKFLNDFHKKIKIPIIYDAADSFLNLNRNIKNNIIISCSFHPTKTLGANESGLIICKNQISSNIKRILNFGIETNKPNLNTIGFNGKFSEYDAAIFLANYKNINKKISRNKKLISEFKKVLTKKFRVLNSNNIKTNKIIIYSNVSFSKIFKTLKSFNIVAKKFWSPNPMHKINIFKKYPKTSMNYTNDYSKKYFGFFINKDLKISQVKIISQKLLRIK
tara:strand:- start:7808 stop:8887 length:1080 start_codon:yes stop_codon:yes gene_type:complete